MKRMPANPTPKPSAPPVTDSSTLSVSICRTMRPRLAPKLSRTAISRRRAADRASSRLARFAQAIASISPTMVIST